MSSFPLPPFHKPPRTVKSIFSDKATKKLKYKINLICKIWQKQLKLGQ